MTAVHDQECLNSIGRAPQSIVAWVLSASYLYYVRDASLLSDGLFDRLMRAMQNSWPLISHPHKYLITESDLEAGSLHQLRPEDYPSIVKSSACRLMGISYE